MSVSLKKNDYPHKKHGALPFMQQLIQAYDNCEPRFVLEKIVMDAFEAGTAEGMARVLMIARDIGAADVNTREKS